MELGPGHHIKYGYLGQRGTLTGACGTVGHSAPLDPAPLACSDLWGTVPKPMVHIENKTAHSPRPLALQDGLVGPCPVSQHGRCSISMGGGRI